MKMSATRKQLMMRSRKGDTGIANEDIALEMQRLFDPYNMDHVPVEKRLDGFRKRDLAMVKHYKAAVHIFGGPASRKRIIVAPPMETPLKIRLGLYLNQPHYPVPAIMNSVLKPAAAKPTFLSEEEIVEKEKKEKEVNYKDWFCKRQQLRTNLDQMGLSEEYLQRKSDKSELEKRVQHKMKEVRTQRPPSPPPPQPIMKEKEPPVVPNVKIPVPAAVQTLDRFLAEKKLRLIDLFRKADRNQDWKLSKEELQTAVKKYNIPLSGADVDDLLVALDTNFDELLDFKEIAKGISALKTERRASKRLESAKMATIREPQSSALSKISPFSRDQLDSNQNSIAGLLSREQSDFGQPLVDNFVAVDIGEEADKPFAQQEDRNDNPSPNRTGSSLLSGSSTPSSLEVPPPDLRRECMVLSSPEEMVELRKHDRTVLELTRKKKWPWPKSKVSSYLDERPGVIRIGHKEVDQHCLVSTLDGESGPLMDRFRRATLREYFKAIQICEEKGLVLNRHLLDRVLLYPPEMPRFECMKKIAIPRGPLANLSEDFVRQSELAVPEDSHKDKAQVSSLGALAMDTRHQYPPSSKVAPVPTRENLSTGRALIQRKSDIWMSLEEYDQYTKDKARQWSVASRNAHYHPEQLPKRFGKLKTKAAREGSGKSSQGSGYSRYVLDEAKFWPGYMLHKLVLYEPPPLGSGWGSGYSQGWKLDGASSAFQPTRPHGRRPGNLGKVRVTGPPVQADGTMLDYGIDKHRLLLPRT